MKEMKNITLQELLDSFNNITLYELLTNFNEIKKFNLAKKLKIFILSSDSSDIMNADVKEYYLSDVPLYLLYKKVFKVYHDENNIVVFKL
jgi:hypothetical protein